MERPTAVPPPALQAESGTPRSQPLPAKSRPWRIIHACESVRSVADLVDAQIAAGMKPFVLTGETKQQPASLMEAWHEVRNWRKYLEGCDAPPDPLHSVILHAHNFPSAMAGIRGGMTVVHDLKAFVEDFAVAAGQCTEKSWLARSFRAAEDFVLSRASAIVVHSEVVRKACVLRGVDKADVFPIPAPCGLPMGFDTEWLGRTFGFRQDMITIFATPSPAEGEVLIEAFARAWQEVPNARLFVASAGEHTHQLRTIAQRLEMDEAVFFLMPKDEEPALRSAEIVIATMPFASETSSVGRVGAVDYAVNGIALQAMAHGRGLLAADCALHRDLSPEGRGCLWFGSDETSKDKVRDLAHRIAFMARNADFRIALGENARRHLMETRSAEKVGHMYDEVYRHADARRRKGNDSPGITPILIPRTADI